jgi:hypothetical protein
MSHVSWTIAATTLAAVVSSSSPAHAQSAEAEVLFREGRNLIKQGKLAQGCEKLDASNRIEASVGTLLNLGDCREKLGETASAWAAFRKAESLAKRSNDAKRQSEASRRATGLEAKLSNLVIEVRQPPPGLVIKRDNEVIDSGGWNTALPVDPDSYTIIAEAPGHKPWRLEVNVQPGQRRRVVVVPPLAKLPDDVKPDATQPTYQPVPEPVVIPTPGPATTNTTVNIRQYRSRTWSTTRGVAVAIGVAGTAALITGAYFGSRASDLQDRSDAICPTTLCDDASGLRLNDEAQQAANRTNIALAVGGAAIVTAGVMWFLGKPDDELIVAPAFGDRQAGVSLRGRF